MILLNMRNYRMFLNMENMINYKVSLNTGNTWIYWIFSKIFENDRQRHLTIYRSVFETHYISFSYRFSYIPINLKMDQKSGKRYGKITRIIWPFSSSNASTILNSNPQYILVYIVVTDRSTKTHLIFLRTIHDPWVHADNTHDTTYIIVSVRPVDPHHKAGRIK
jgi:hypothetical protein